MIPVHIELRFASILLVRLIFHFIISFNLCSVDSNFILFLFQKTSGTILILFFVNFALKINLKNDVRIFNW